MVSGLTVCTKDYLTTLKTYSVTLRTAVTASGKTPYDAIADAANCTMIVENNRRRDDVFYSDVEATAAS